MALYKSNAKNTIFNGLGQKKGIEIPIRTQALIPN